MTTDKYDLHELDYSVQGWDTILAADMEILDAVIHTRIEGTGGETAAAYSAMYFNADGEYYKAQADGSKQPCMGLALESVSNGVAFRLQRVGPITNSSWSWTPGGLVFLDPSTAGALTQTDPIVHRNIIGVALSATSIFLMLGYEKAAPDKKVQTLTCADSVTVNWALGSTAIITLDRATTALTFSGAYDGQKCMLIIKQDATGSRLVTFGAEVRYGTDLPSAPTLTTTASKKDRLGYIYDGGDSKYDFVAINRGY